MVFSTYFDTVLFRIGCLDTLVSKSTCLDTMVVKRACLVTFVFRCASGNCHKYDDVHNTSDTLQYKTARSAGVGHRLANMARVRKRSAVFAVWEDLLRRTVVE